MPKVEKNRGIVQSKFKTNLSDIVLIVAIIGLGVLVLYLARTHFAQRVPESYGSVTGQQSASMQTNTVTPTLTIAARPTRDSAHQPPTRDPEEPTFDDPALVDPTPSGLDTMPSTPLPQDPFHLTICSERDNSLGAVVPRSEIIIIGTVSKILPSRWTTPDGKRPSNPHESGVETMYKYGIITQLDVTIEQQIHGVRQEGYIRIAVNGGKIGSDSVDQCGDTDFQVGQRVVLFLSWKGKSKLDREAWLLVSRYTINDQGIAFNQQQEIPLDELLRQIESLAPVPTPKP